MSRDIVVKTPLCGQASLLMFPDVRLLTPFSRIQQITPSHFNLSFTWWRTKKYSWIHLKSRFILRMFCRVMGERKIVFFILVQGIMFTKHASCTNSALFKTRENTRLNGHVVKQFLSPSLMSCNHWFSVRAIRGEQERNLWTKPIWIHQSENKSWWWKRGDILFAREGT